jgi:hypothetical protein
MKKFKDIKKGFGQEALAARLKDAGFGTDERETELQKQKEEMDARHGKADAEMEERNKAWKAQYGKKPVQEAVEQEHTSADTSLNQVSSGIKYAAKNGLIKPNSLNVEHGGGKYDTGKAHVESAVEGAKMHIHDPFNRSAEHNNAVKSETTGKADYAGMHNVLNVIKEPAAREGALHELKSFMKPKTGVAHVTVYEGDKSGNARMSKADKGRGSSWQNHASTESYMPEVKKVFPEHTHTVERKGANIIIRQK